MVAPATARTPPSPRSASVPLFSPCSHVGTCTTCRRNFLKPYGGVFFRSFKYTCRVATCMDTGRVLATLAPSSARSSGRRSPRLRVGHLPLGLGSCVVQDAAITEIRASMAALKHESKRAPSSYLSIWRARRPRASESHGACSDQCGTNANARGSDIRGLRFGPRGRRALPS